MLVIKIELHSASTKRVRLIGKMIIRNVSTRADGKRAHYYRNGDSLCRKIGWYTGPLEVDVFASKDDCAACRKKLDREKQKNK